MTKPRAPELSALIVERKLSTAFFDSLANARSHIPLKWPIYVSTAPANWPMFEQESWRKQNIFVKRDITAPATIQHYSDLMLNCRTWDSFESEFVLVFQTDSRFCSTSPYTLEQFVRAKYAWIGAPWSADWPDPNKIAHSLVGNGGFSLRLRAAMLACCTNKRARWAEDLELVRCLKDNADDGWEIAPIKLAERFAAESYYPSNETVAPLGVHKTYSHMQPNAKLHTLCPEYTGLAYVLQKMPK